MEENYQAAENNFCIYFFDALFAANTQEKCKSTTTSLQSVVSVPKCPSGSWGQGVSRGMRCWLQLMNLKVQSLIQGLRGFVLFVCFLKNQNPKHCWKQSKYNRREEEMVLLQAHLGKEGCCLPCHLQWAPGDRALHCTWCTELKVSSFGNPHGGCRCSESQQTKSGMWLRELDQGAEGRHITVLGLFINTAEAE